MATVIDTLVTEYRMKNSQYLQGAAQVSSATKSTGSSMAGFKKAADVAQGGLSGFSDGLRGAINQIPILGTLLTGAAVGVAAFSGYAMAQAAELEALTLGLQNYAGSVEETQKQLARLKEVAKLPGLGFKEAIEGSIALQAVGFDARLAERALSSFGNALASVGKGKSDLDGVILALSQIISKGAISAEEINQLAERVPQIRQAMMAAFGSANPEAITKGGVGPQAFVQGIIKELEKLPKAPNAAKNFFENLQDVGFRAFASIGSVLNKVLLPEMEKLVSFVSFLTESGALERITKGLVGMTGVGTVGSPLVTVFSYVAATLEEMPNILKGVATVFAGLFEKAQALLAGIVKVLKDIGENWFAQQIGLGGLANLAVGPLGNSETVLKGLTQLSGSKDAISKRAEGYMKGFNTPADAVKSNEPQQAGGFTVPEALNNIAVTNKQIADNTKEMLDFQTALIGGGQVGQQAFNGLEVAKVSGGMSPVHKAAMKFADELSNIMGQNQLRTSRTYGYNR
jgi:tape measure domain-containing protein